MARALSSESATSAGTTSSEDLFQAIDGRTVTWGSRRFTVEIYGITELTDARWIQLRLLGEVEWMVTLRLPPGSDESTTMRALWVVLAEEAADALDEEQRA